MKRIDPAKIKLTKEEREIERAALRGEYVTSSKEEIEEIAEALRRRKKEAVLHIRINQGDLDNLKNKAKKLGIKYQTFIAEILHRIAA